MAVDGLEVLMVIRIQLLWKTCFDYLELES